MAGSFLVRGVLRQGVGVSKYENMCLETGGPGPGKYVRTLARLSMQKESKDY